MITNIFDSVRILRDSIIRRRFLQQLSGAAAAGLGLRTVLASQAEQLRKQGKSMILLWMQGGPSQFETLDPKPGKENGGPTEAIQTSVAGIQIAENFPLVAKQMQDIAIVRSMTNKEGSHPRATYQMHTGYVPAGSVKHPSFGSCVCQQIGHVDGQLPSFVSIGSTQGAGFLGMDYEPFVVSRPGQLPENIALPVSRDRFDRRTELLGKMTGEFARSGSEQLAKTHDSLYGKASRLVLTPETEAFDISSEPAALKDAYGDSNFGRGCLLARRLVERGVAFVEVRSGNWDTHQNNFEECAKNAAEVDPGTATLLSDLRDRGMLKDTVVVWMGEFGRTPKINPREGRDHYPKVFSMMMAGGGIRGGQVYGSSTADGSEIAENPVTVPDLMRTVCKALGVNADHENMSPQGRPLKVVDGGKEVDSLLS
ncbi:MAG: DUF1501 domain-containing protein [Planctomycetaceae bacterium]|nr:DUF1501 domain-containing protein [Planctomycetaceae bacterium]